MSIACWTLLEHRSAKPVCLVAMTSLCSAKMEMLFVATFLLAT